MATSKKNVSAADVRAWAREKGYPVGERGNLAAELIADFNAVHRTKVYEPGVPATEVA